MLEDFTLTFSYEHYKSLFRNSHSHRKPTGSIFLFKGIYFPVRDIVQNNSFIKNLYTPETFGYFESAKTIKGPKFTSFIHNFSLEKQENELFCIDFLELEREQGDYPEFSLEVE